MLKSQYQKDLFLSIVYTVMAIPILIFIKSQVTLIPYTNQGFFCNDIEIRYPNKSSTVDSSLMQLIYFSIIIAVIIISELVNHSMRICPAICRSVYWGDVIFMILFYYCGVIANAITTNFFKTTASRLRPNFIDVCQPANLTSLCPIGSIDFIEDFTCLGESRPDLHFSFPSSHASHSMYFLFFLMMYTNLSAFKQQHLFVVRPIIQLIALNVSVFICLSRVRDNKHRYEDIFGGAVLGAVIAYIMINNIYKPLAHKSTSEDSMYGTYDSINDDEKVSLYGSVA